MKKKEQNFRFGFIEYFIETRNIKNEKVAAWNEMPLAFLRMKFKNFFLCVFYF